MGIIPQSSPVYTKLNDLSKDCKIVIFSGLPGTGKSLYINEFFDLAISNKRNVTVIQWDKARKAFELPEIMERFPMGDGVIHNGVKLIAGEFIKYSVGSWIGNAAENDLLLIEAPLVGHRFIELMEQGDVESEVEQALSAGSCKVIVPIPSKEIRRKIEEERERQVDENAKEWIGAKPSVMRKLWILVYNIAIEMGMDLEINDQAEYDPKVIEFVFNKISKHRSFIALNIDEVFEVPEQSEAELHRLDSIIAEPEMALKLFKKVITLYPTDESIDAYVASWYWQ